MADVLGKEIAVYDFKLSQSMFGKNKSGLCLSLQIEIEGEKRVVFTGSDVLIELVNQLKEDSFPFKTRIVKKGESFVFT